MVLMGDLDGSRWACVLCGRPLLWLSPSYLLHSGGPMPTALLICGSDWVSPLFLPAIVPFLVNVGRCGHVKGDSAAFSTALSWTKVHVKKLYLFGIIFKSFVGFDFKTCMFIMWSAGFLLTLSTLRMLILTYIYIYFWFSAKSNRPSHWKATAYLSYQRLSSECSFFFVSEQINK